MFNTLVVNYSWHYRDLLIFFPIMLALVSFTTYWFIFKSDRIRAHFYQKYDADTASIKYILFSKYLGLLLFAIVPGILSLILFPQFSLKDYGLAIKPETTLISIEWISGLWLLAIPLAYLSGRKLRNQANYPQIRAKVWNRRLIFNYAIGWAAYLFGYEFLFRGILLFSLVRTIGVWPAIAVNIALYSATHIPKGLDETIGAVVLGMILCVLTISTGTIWIAFFVHVALAWTNSYTALRYNPEMKIVKI